VASATPEPVADRRDGHECGGNPGKLRAPMSASGCAAKLEQYCGRDTKGMIVEALRGSVRA
jgi:hypothetical protein